MQELARRIMVRSWPRRRFHPGDLDWWVTLARDREPSMPNRVAVWPAEDGDRIDAFAWFGPPGELDLLIDPEAVRDLEAVVRALVDWAESRRAAFGAAGTEPLRAWVERDAGAEVRAFERLGFRAEDQPGFRSFSGDLAIRSAWPAPQLPAGVEIRAIAGDADIAARVACSRAAFPTSTMTPERYRGVLDAATYRPDLDLVAVRSDGSVVAFALGWLDVPSGIVLLEPVGVHPDWQHRGLGGEICRAVLRAAADLGATRGAVQAEALNPAAMALYARLGLAVASEIVPYIRQPAAAP